MKISNLVVLGSLSLVLSGCWTLSETEYPEVAIERLPTGKTVAVSLVGFEADVQKYVPIAGHEQMATSAGDREDGPCAIENSSTNAYYCTRNTLTRKLIDRASVGLERKGYAVGNYNPQYAVEMKFMGPFDRDYDALKQLGLAICTIFTAEKNVVTWRAALKVYDRTDGNKVVFEKDYEQLYEVFVWGPIPVASPACSPKITGTACDSWILTALTDMGVADAAKFLRDKAK